MTRLYIVEPYVLTTSEDGWTGVRELARQKCYARSTAEAAEKVQRRLSPLGPVQVRYALLAKDMLPSPLSPRRNT